MIKLIRNNLYLIKTKIVKQTFVLFGSQILFVGLGVIVATLNTRILGPKDYGILSFFGLITGFVVLFFPFGFFSSGAVLLSQEKEKRKERELLGTLILIGFLMGFGYSLFVFISSFFIDSIFNTDINHILRIFSPILFILLFQTLIAQVSKGTNKIIHLAWFNIIPRSLYIIGIISILLLGVTRIKVSTLILLNLIAVIIGVIIIIYIFKPLFINSKKNLKKIWQKNKEYGIHVYLGRITTQSTYKLDGIFISYFVNIIQLGFYSLASSITGLMAILPQSLSISLFKDFANKDKIPKKVILFNFVWLSFCTISLVLLGKFIVTFFFTDKFLPVVPLIFPLALAGFFQGMYQPYIQFLGAHEKGKYQRNAALFCSVCFLGTNILLIPPFGALGAAIARVISMGFAYFLNLFYYNKTIRPNN